MMPVTYQSAPCVRCGGTERYVVGNVCRPCKRMRERSYYEPSLRRAYESKSSAKSCKAAAHFSTLKAKAEDYANEAMRDWQARNPLATPAERYAALARIRHIANDMITDGKPMPVRNSEGRLTAVHKLEDGLQPSTN